MLKMKKFHKVLFRSTENNEPYLKELRSFTKLSPARLIAITTGLGWEPW